MAPRDKLNLAHGCFWPCWKALGSSFLLFPVTALAWCKALRDEAYPDPFTPQMPGFLLPRRLTPPSPRPPRHWPLQVGNWKAPGSLPAGTELATGVGGHSARPGKPQPGENDSRFLTNVTEQPLLLHLETWEGSCCFTITS